MAARYRLIRTDKEPPGRWRYELVLPDGTVAHIGPSHTFEHLVRDVVSRAASAGLSVPSNEQIEDQICRRAGLQGCRSEDGAPIDPRPPAIEQRRILSPDIYGPRLWGYLHMFGAVFDQDHFRSAVRMTKTVLADKRHGCIKCVNHFNDFLARYPYQAVETARQASVWSWSAHNHATEQKGYKGRKAMSYTQAARLYGWEPLSHETLQETLASLKRTSS